MSQKKVYNRILVVVAAGSLVNARLQGDGQLHEEGAGRSVQHDLQPVHAILVQLAVSLQARVDQAARDLAAIRHRLARELTKTAEVLTNLGEVV